MNDTILLFDRSAIFSSNSHLWQSASGLGTCMIPQAVSDEINSVVSGFGSDGDDLKLASEF